MNKQYLAADAYALARQRLPETRMAITHKFKIETKDGPAKGYIVVGLFESGQPGELFIHLDKSNARVWANSVGILTSLALQSGIPLEIIVSKLAFQIGEPSGMTKHPKIHMAKSIVDYVFRWMGYEFIEGYGEEKKS
jgi:ribonucleoside-diphosphate reductase alpha chain